MEKSKSNFQNLNPHICILEKSELGKLGEDMAVAWLKGHHYRILETNWRAGRSEVDIIAMEGNAIVFIEVKSRSSEFHDFPESAVDHAKQKSMIRAASAYIESSGHQGSIRFDIISIVLLPHVKKLTHFRDAFFPLSSS